MKRDPIIRFWESVEVRGEDECWPWLKARLKTGYGLFKERSYVQVYAHRFAYELAHGPIPPGLSVDHLCSIRWCVNPAHLDVCTSEENSHRGAERRKVCRNGLHDMTVPGAWKHLSNGTRTCHLCLRENWRRNDIKRRGATAPASRASSP